MENIKQNLLLKIDFDDESKNVTVFSVNRKSEFVAELALDGKDAESFVESLFKYPFLSSKEE